jgi:acetoin utilization deacetylase AcuC-like enzyme
MAHPARVLPVQAFYADHFILPLPAGHRFPMAKYGRLRERLAAEWPAILLGQALPASDGELALVHTPAYIGAIQHGTLPPAAQREIGFPWSTAMAERARRSVGATIQACRAAMAGDGLAANIAGGTHHAYADKGSGFCTRATAPRTSSRTIPRSSPSRCTARRTSPSARSPAT